MLSMITSGGLYFAPVASFETRTSPGRVVVMVVVAVAVAVAVAVVGIEQRYVWERLGLGAWCMVHGGERLQATYSTAVTYTIPRYWNSRGRNVSARALASSLDIPSACTSLDLNPTHTV